MLCTRRDVHCIFGAMPYQRIPYRSQRECGGLYSLLPVDYSLAVEEKERPGEYFPVEEGGGYTALFSSKDLCMIDYLTDLKKAGADALKIEGRMKSLYYTALVTRAYRKRIDALCGKISPAEAEPFVKELYNTAHRAFGTGFYFSKDDANKTTCGNQSRRIVWPVLSGRPRQ